MTKRMLIDASHPEETRVVVLDGSRLEEFDIEAASRKPLKGNIYLAKIVRVEPSLQAAFVEYGGNRHGFLAFGEIHPDYYQIPVADRERLIRMQAEEAAEEQAEEDRAARRASRGHHSAPQAEGTIDTTSFGAAQAADNADEFDPQPSFETTPEFDGEPESVQDDAPSGDDAADHAPVADDTTLHEGEDAPPRPRAQPARMDGDTLSVDPDTGEARGTRSGEDEGPEAPSYDDIETVATDAPPPETIGGESEDSSREPRRIPSRWLKNYKIQEVIKRRQVVLVQVVKEERGTKGAALTTYLSLAGRYSVLMPNTPRGGGVSRKITSQADRKRLKEVIDELGMPEGMGVIVRTAGAQRPKPEIRRDCEYLLRLWDSIREVTLRSTAPALIYEEADLIKRSIRDGYSRDIEEVLVEGDDAYQQVRDFVGMLMPAHAKKVIAFRDRAMPLFAKFGVEGQLDAMHSPTCQLKSGGYIVINQTEALVAIDVNSGRSTKERHIEETALRTNLEAADEVARQLRLRDLAGLIVIDFIDMESNRNNAQVERRLKEALKHDRARIQLGRISHFGLMEMSRQRLRPSLAETSLVVCPHCNGQGHMRSTESAALTVLRAIEEEGAKGKAAEITVKVHSAVALYLLNHKRARLADIEARHGMTVLFLPDDTLIPPSLKIERTKAMVAREAVIAPPEPARAALPAQTAIEIEGEDEEEGEDGDEDSAEPGAEEGAEARGGERTNGARAEGEREGGKRRRRRRRRGSKREDGRDVASGAEAQGAFGQTSLASDAQVFGAAPEDAPPGASADSERAGPTGTADPNGDDDETDGDASEAADTQAFAGETQAEAQERQRRRRGRRGGRRRRRDGEGEGETPVASAPAPTPAPPPPPVPTRPFLGATPANPFGEGFDLFDAFDTTPREEPPPRPAPPRDEPAPRAARTVPIEAAPPPPPPVTIREAEAPVEEPVEATASEPELVAPPVEVPAPAEPVAEAKAAAPEPVELPVELPLGEPVADEPEKPKAKRSTRKAKPAEEPKAVEPAPAEPEAPKRRRSTRAKAAEPDLVAPEAVAPDPVAPVVEEAPAPRKRRSRAAEAAPPEAVTLPVEAEAPAPAPAEPAAQSPEVSAEAKPAVAPIEIKDGSEGAARRRGWWKRS